MKYRLMKYSSKEAIIAYATNNQEIETKVAFGREDELIHSWIAYGKDKNIFITELFVPKEHRGTGKAKELLNFVISMAKQTGIKRIELSPSDCFGSDLKRLKSFYKSFGFKTEDINIMSMSI